MVASSALSDDLQFDELPDTSLHARDARTDLVGNGLVRWKTKTLLVRMLRQAVINSDADWTYGASVFIEKYLADPIPVTFAKIPDCYFFIRHTREIKAWRGSTKTQTAPYRSSQWDGLALRGE